jgi:glycosyltransferase involved in cell wall biosynthesis
VPALVSILIPCYNAAPWLAATLESALGQTWPQCEIVVVDDGSQDASLAVAEPFRRHGVTVIGQPNRGAAAARNAALRASRGDWIQFLDADDLLAPHKIELQLAAAARQPGEWMHAARWARFTGDPSSAQFVPEVLCCDADPVTWNVLKLEEHAMMHPAAWLSPRSLVDRAGPWDETLTLDDDGEYFSRLVLLSAGVRYCPEAITLYRSQLASSLSRSKSDRAWDSALRSTEAIATRLLAREDSPRTRHACAAALQRLIYEVYPRAPLVQRRARALAARWGGAPEVRPMGGARFHRLSRFLGWRLARRVQLALEK